MRLKKLFLLFLLFSPVLGFAKGSIKGKIINKESGEIMDFVTIQLVDADTQKPLAIGTSSDLDGNFVLPDVKNGNYLVRITNIGSVPKDIPVNVKDGNTDLGIILLEDDSKVLEEVVVEGVKSQMRFELDRKIFNVDANVMAAGTSASELLESIPSIEVDQDGEVSLRGNSSVTIWINGKESGLTSDNRAQILEQIPAETIERVEVITNPSAKYSPEGTAGIINIILKKDRRAGYFGSAEISANSRGGGNAGVNINFNSGKFDAFAGLGFRMRHNKGGAVMNREYSDGYFTNSISESPNHGNNLFLRLGATYHATDKDDLSLSGFGMLGHHWQHSLTEFTSNLPGNWISNTDYSRRKGNMRGAHLELGYIHKWTDTNLIDISGSFNHWSGPNNNYYEQDITYEDREEDIYQEQYMNMKSNSWEVKVDYSNQLNKILKFEAGYNGNFSKEDSPTDTYMGFTPETIIRDEDLYNRFIYRNNINALYATLGGTINKFSFSAGLRSESWQVRTRSLAFGQAINDVPEYKKNNFSLFPSAFLSLSLPYENEIQINYTRRLRRPWGGQLNSFHDISDPTNISFGNPELQPQYSNSYELNYIKNWLWHAISVSAYLRTTSNMMNRISYLDSDVMYSTWANVADETNSGCEIVVKNNLFRVLDLTTTVNLYNNHISSWKYSLLTESGKEITLTGDKKDSFAWDARIMAGLKLPWGMSFQASGNYNSKMLSAQGSRQGGWSVDIGLRKNLGNWSFSLNCRDLFDSRKFKSTTDGLDYVQYNERWRGGRTVRLTIKYSFGNMSQKKNSQYDDMPTENPGYGDIEM